MNSEAGLTVSVSVKVATVAFVILAPNELVIGVPPVAVKLSLPATTAVVVTGMPYTPSWLSRMVMV